MEGVSHDSELTSDDSIGIVEQEETSIPDNFEWTNEKHSLYLKSMEASFVDQLYNLKNLFSLSPVSQHGVDVKLCRQGSPSGSGQLEAWEHCHRPKKIRRTADPQPIVVDRSGKFLENPWIKYFRSGGSTDVALDNDTFEHQPLGSSCRSGRISRLPIDGECRHVSLNLNEEFTGQNFTDEDSVNSAPSGQGARRSRTLDTSAAIDKDQVVPFGKVTLANARSQ